MERSLEHELEHELESELESESEFENEAEGELEALGEGEMEGELEGEGEFENEGELESEGESELEQGEQFLGSIASAAKTLLGEGEGEAEGEFELEHEYELEHEQGEQFFGKAFRGIGRLVKRAAPALKQIARVAAPIVGKAVGGFIGGPLGAMHGAKLAQLAAARLREQEMEGEYELESHELELGEHEHEYELGENEISSELNEHEAMAEAMAHYAAFSESEYESEAMVGAATTVGLSPRDRRALRRLVPNLVRGAAILTRVLRMRRSTRPFVRVVPTIMRRTIRTLRRRAEAGQPITRRRAGAIMARQTRRVLASPRYCGSVLRRNIRATRSISRPSTISGGIAGARRRRN